MDTFIDGTPIPDDYLNKVQELVKAACGAEEKCTPEELEAESQRYRTRHNLFASVHTTEAAEGKKQTQDLLKLLDKAFGIEFLGWLGGETAIITDAKRWWWTLFDNGGEIQVERINVEPENQSWFAVPTDCNMCENPNIGTTAYRISKILKGEAIEWEWKFPEEHFTLYL